MLLNNLCYYPMKRKRIIIISTCLAVFAIALIGGFSIVKCQAQQSIFDDKGHHKEVQRFKDVMANASDEELFLKY